MGREHLEEETCVCKKGASGSGLNSKELLERVCSLDVMQSALWNRNVVKQDNAFQNVVHFPRKANILLLEVPKGALAAERNLTD